MKMRLLLLRTMIHRLLRTMIHRKKREVTKKSQIGKIPSLRLRMTMMTIRMKTKIRIKVEAAMGKVMAVMGRSECLRGR
jgi:hypothetical protein